MSTTVVTNVIVQRICHPLTYKGERHPYGKGDIEQQRAEETDRVE
jgi:hypothetical protein